VSQENVKIVQALYEGWLHGDLGMELLDPEISVVESSTVPGAVEAHGIDAVRRYMEGFDKHWEAIRFEPEEYIDLGDHVVVVARLTGTGRRSGVEVSRTWAYVWTLRGGRALRMAAFDDRAEALDAVGLEE
jgi:uncharacterized protein